jgi:hypothetical protein
VADLPRERTQFKLLLCNHFKNLPGRSRRTASRQRHLQAACLQLSAATPAAKRRREAEALKRLCGWHLHERRSTEYVEFFSSNVGGAI